MKVCRESIDTFYSDSDYQQEISALEVDKAELGRDKPEEQFLSIMWMRQ